MKDKVASRTAQYMALFRAFETKQGVDKRLFNDPYAAAFIEPVYKLMVGLYGWSVAKKIIDRLIEKRIPGAFSSGVARTKYIDDVLLQTIEDGTRQVIILGAGFDTRASRLPFLKNIPVIEIDHPDTARLKQQKMKERLGALPAQVRYLQIDFNKESLAELAAREQLDFSKPTTIIWEGVTNYLTTEAVAATFRFFQNFNRGPFIIFTYVHQQVLDEPAAFYGAAKLLQDVAAIEEKWTFGLYPSQVASYLSSFGIQLLEDEGAADYRARYGRQEKGYEFYHVAVGKRM